jgi:hypothetical protein
MFELENEGTTVKIFLAGKCTLTKNKVKSSKYIELAA